MEMKVHEEREPPKKKSMTFKATPYIAEDDESMDKNEEEEFTMLVRKLGKLFYKKSRMSNYQKGRTQGKGNREKRRWVRVTIASR